MAPVVMVKLVCPDGLRYVVVRMPGPPGPSGPGEPLLGGGARLEGGPKGGMPVSMSMVS